MAATRGDEAGALGSVVHGTLDLAGLDVPVVEITGAHDGPALTVIAGVHGCEYAPMAAVRRWAGELEPASLRGRVRAVPVLNLPAFWARSPFVVPEDGKNLNRCFPGNPAGTFTERLAHAAFTQLICRPRTAVVDAHAGDLVEALEPFALYHAGSAQARARELANAYGLRYVARHQRKPSQGLTGMTSAAAAAIGVPAIIAEATAGGGQVDSASVELHVRGLYRVLDMLGMSRGGAHWEDDRAPSFLRNFDWLYCRTAGWWEPRACSRRRRSPRRVAARFHRDQHRRRDGAGGDPRPCRRRGALLDQLAGRVRRRPAARAGLRVTRVAVAVREQIP